MTDPRRVDVAPVLLSDSRVVTFDRASTVQWINNTPINWLLQFLCQFFPAFRQEVMTQRVKNHFKLPEWRL